MPLNTKGKDYIIGDIHGEYSKLMSKLKSVGFDFCNDRLFSVGDFIDRGLDSLRCYTLLMQDWFYAIRGNHEDALIDLKRYGYIDGYLARLNGSDWFIDIENIDMMWDIADTLDNLPYIIELDTPSGKIGIVHASPLGYHWNDLVLGVMHDTCTYNHKKYRDACIWDREFYLYCDQGKHKDRSIEGIDYVVTGHNHCNTPKIVNNFYSIATMDKEDNSEFNFLLLDTSTMELI